MSLAILPAAPVAPARPLQVVLDGPDNLDVRARRVRDLVGQFEHHLRVARTIAAEIGRELLAAKRRLKEDVGFGHWEDYVRLECGIPERSAREYMAVARAEERGLLDGLPADLALRETVRVIREHRRRGDVAAAGLPDPRRVCAPAPLDVAGVHVEQAWAHDLPIGDDLVDLQLWSPPYGVGIAYEDGIDDRLAYEEYLERAEAWSAEAYRVAAWGGRVCVNVPIDARPPVPDPARPGALVSGPARPMAYDWQRLLEAAGFTYQTTIIWTKGGSGQTCDSTARGSDGPNAPVVTSAVEVVLVVSKGAMNRGERGRAHDTAHEEFLRWRNGVWDFLPEQGGRRAGSPVPWPRIMPWRLIKTYSFPGDLVMDQFLGRGTSGWAARRLGRPFYGFDASPTQVAIAGPFILDDAEPDVDDPLLRGPFPGSTTS